MKYHAFISYSHSDEAIASWLHRAMETFSVPKDLVGKETGRGEVVPARVFPVFRDREELPTSADLGEVIQSALRESRYLIVICSPRAARSRWVNEEILGFKRLGKANRILALIASGEPNAAEGKPGVSPDDECFPPALKHPLHADGTLDDSVLAEPIAGDARPGKDGRQDALLKLLAGVLGVNFDDLKRRDDIRRRQRQRAVLATVSLLAIAFAFLAGVALWQWRESETRGVEIRRGMAAADVEHALGLGPSQAVESIRLLARAIRLDPDVPGAVEALWLRLSGRSWMAPVQTRRVFGAAVRTGAPAGDAFVGLASDGVLEVATLPGAPLLRRDGVSSFRISPDGARVAVALASGGVEIHPVSGGGGKSAGTFRVSALAWAGPRLFVGTDSGELVCVDGESGSPLFTSGVGGPVVEVAPSPDGNLVAVSVRGIGAVVLPTRPGGAVSLVWPRDTPSLLDAFPAPVKQLLWQGSSTLALLGADRQVHLAEVSAEGVASGFRSVAMDIPPIEAGVLADGRLIVGCFDGSVIELRGEEPVRVASAPPFADRLVDLLTTSSGGVFRLFASGRIDCVLNAGPPVEPFCPEFVATSLAVANTHIVALGGSRDVVLVPATPMRLRDGLKIVELPSELPSGPSALLGEVFLSGVGSGVEAFHFVTGTREPFVSLDGPALALGVSDDGQTVAVADAVKFSLVGRDRRVLKSAPHGLAAPDFLAGWQIVWEPSGTWAALAAPGALAAKAFVLGNFGSATLDFPSGLGVIVPDGDAAMWAAGPGELKNLTLPDGATQRTLPLPAVFAGPAAFPRTIALAPDEESIAAASLGGDLAAFEIATGKVQTVTELGPVALLAFSEGGEVLATVNDFGLARTWTGTLEPRATWEVAPGKEGLSVLWAAALPNGLLATLDRFSGMSVSDFDGRKLGGFAGERNDLPDFLVLAAGRSGNTLWWVAPGRDRARLHLAPTTPPATASDLAETADFLTNGSLEIDGSVRPGPARPAMPLHP